MAFLVHITGLPSRRLSLALPRSCNSLWLLTALSPSVPRCHQRPLLVLVLSEVGGETDARHPIAYTSVSPAARGALHAGPCTYLGTVCPWLHPALAAAASGIPQLSVPWPSRPNWSSRAALQSLTCTLSALCTLPASASHAALGHVPRPPSTSTSLPPEPPLSPVRTGTATLTSLSPTLSRKLAAAARRYHLLRSHPVAGAAGVLALPCPALPASMGSLNPS